MKVFKSLEEYVSNGPAVVTTGTFDGVHRGHQEIIKRLGDYSENMGAESVVLTFAPHPRIVLNPDSRDLRLLSTEAEKVRRLESFGVKNLIIHPFTREFSNLSSLDFIHDIIVNKLNARRIILGYDHHFGKDRQGSLALLMEKGNEFQFSVDQVPEINVDGLPLSSTRIRQEILTGEVELAARQLGYFYCLEGVVVKGKQLGRTIGFPTANINVTDPYKLLPAIGIYAVKVELSGESLDGMLSIGKNPTVGGTELTIEVNILNFNKDIYGEPIAVHFVAWMRGEENFPGLEALKEQLFKDREHAIKLLTSASLPG